MSRYSFRARAATVAAVLSVALGGLSAAAISPASAAEKDNDSGAQRFLVKTATPAPGGGVSTAAATATVESAGGTVVSTLQVLPGAMVVEIASKDSKDLVGAPGVTEVIPDAPASVADTQTSPTNWGLDRSDQDNLPLNNTYNYATEGTGVRAYVVDTGITSHTELSGRVISGFTTIDDGNGTGDCDGHGTHVAGIIGGSVSGVAKDTTLVSVRVFDCEGDGFFSDVLLGLEWIYDNHPAGTPAIANMSLGGAAGSAIADDVNDAIAALAADKNITTIAAAGNDNTDACTITPANATVAITVAATNPDDSRASYSNYGSCVDIHAPGSSIASASHTNANGYVLLSGTSMAAPHVAGAAALLLEADPTLNVSAVTSAILSTATSGTVTGTNGSPNLMLRTLHTAPDAPTNVSATEASSTSITVSWTAPTYDGGDGPLTYTVYSTTDDGDTYTEETSVVDTSTATVTGLTADGSVYRFAVEASNPTGSSAKTNLTTGIQLGYAAPSAVVGLTASAGDAEIGLSWSAPTDDGGDAISGYTIEKAASSGGPWSAVGTTASTTYTVSGLDNGSEHFLRVAAENNAGLGEWAVTSATPVAVLPGVPSSPTAGSITETSAVLTWSAPEMGTVESYLVEYRKQGSSSWTQVPVTEGTSVSLTSLDSAATYEFRVAAVSEAGEGDFSGIGSFATATPPPPPPPAAPPASPAPTPPPASAPLTGGSSSGGSASGGGGGGGLNEVSTIVPSATGAPGTQIALAGWGLSTTRSVTFNDFPAEFTVISDSQVDVIVPDIPAGVYVVHAVLTPTVGRASYWAGFAVTPTTPGSTGNESDATPIPTPVSDDVALPDVALESPAEMTREDVASIPVEDIARLNPADVRQLSVAAVRGFTSQQAAQLQARHTAALRPARMRAFSLDAVAALTPQAASGIRPAALRKIRPRVVAALTPEAFGELRPTAVKKMRTAQAKRITAEQAQEMTRQQVRAMRPNVLRRVTPDAISQLSADAVDGLRAAQLRRLTTSQRSALDN